MWELTSSDKDQVLAIFEHLHAHPEISWQEYATRDYLLGFLKKADCQIRTFDDCAGMVVQWGKGQPQVALRADMDALWQEVDGHFCANHSCGHDAHMAVVMGTLLNLPRYLDPKQVAVRVVFQPAEEKGLGALKMMDHDAMEGILYFYGLHVRPASELALGLLAPAIQHGASAALLGDIKGIGDLHAGRPHLGPNAIEVGSILIQAIGGIHLDPAIPYSVKFTRFQAGGSSSNIIPGNAAFTIDLRAQTNGQMSLLIAAVCHRIQQVASLTATEITYTLSASTPAAEVHPEAQELMARAIRAACGEAAYRPPCVTGGADDFHNYTIRKPDLKATMLALGCGLTPGLHHPHMVFDRSALSVGAQVLTGAVIETLIHLGRIPDAEERCA